MPPVKIPYRIARNLIIDSFIAVVINDYYLIDNILYEGCISHRLAVYLERNMRHYGLDSYNVDLEYDNNLDDYKEINGGNKRIDIIIHKRGTHDSNLIAIEAKKDYPLGDDINKIRGLLREPYNYSYGCLISYSNRRFKIIRNEKDLGAGYESIDRFLL